MTTVKSFKGDISSVSPPSKGKYIYMFLISFDKRPSKAAWYYKVWYYKELILSYPRDKKFKGIAVNKTYHAIHKTETYHVDSVDSHPSYNQDHSKRLPYSVWRENNCRVWCTKKKRQWGILMICMLMIVNRRQSFKKKECFCQSFSFPWSVFFSKENFESPNSKSNQ